MAFEVTLPELFTVSSQEYEALHGVWLKAVKVLPDYTVVHKQDIFVQEQYRSDIGKDDLSFLSRSFERHFNERPFLHHTCYLFITKTTRAQSRRQSDCSVLCRGTLVPKEFASIVRESGHIRLRRLGADEIAGTPESSGILERYLTLSPSGKTPLQDMRLDPDRMWIGDKALCLHTLSDLDDLPGSVHRYERLSTERSDCRLSFAAPVGLLLSCNHIYNQYVRQEVV